MATESQAIELQTSCPSFELLGVDGQKHSLESYASSQILVVGFTCNHCPYVQAYEQRLNQIVADYKDKSVSFICINSNDDQKYPEDSFDHMKQRAQDLGFLFDYLRDETQQVAKSFNAACTPEFYIYGQDRQLEYHGRIDDNYQDASAVKEHYMREALDDLLAKKDLRNRQTSAIGCGIKWKD